MLQHLRLQTVDTLRQGKFGVLTLTAANLDDTDHTAREPLGQWSFHDIIYPYPWILTHKVLWTLETLGER